MPDYPHKLTLLQSTKNPYIRKIRHFTAQSSFRRGNQFPIEGTKLLAEALTAGIPLDTAFFSGSFLQDPQQEPLTNSLLRNVRQCFQVTDEVLQSLSSTTTSQGVLALAERPQPPFSSNLLFPPAIHLLLLDVQDPGNCGTLARSCLAFGGKLLITVGSTCDPFSPKALRASAGAVFHLSVLHFSSFDDFRDHRLFQDLELIAAAPRRGALTHAIDASAPIALLIGNESRGLPAEVLASCATTASLPMEEISESLNAAVAGSLLMYEMAKNLSRGPFRKIQ